MNGINIKRKNILKDYLIINSITNMPTTIDLQKSNHYNLYPDVLKAKKVNGIVWINKITSNPLVKPIIVATELKDYYYGNQGIILRTETPKYVNGEIVRYYNSYGFTKIERIDKLINKKNLHYYEIIEEDKPRYLYFDIEFPTSQLNAFEVLDSLSKAVGDFIKTKRNEGHNWGYDTIQLEKDLISLDVSSFIISKSVGIGEHGNFADIEKWSGHIKVKNICFKNKQDIRKFINNFRYFVLNHPQDKYRGLIYKNRSGIDDTAFDKCVYGKNQAFKMIYQTKGGSIRLQKPTHKLTKFCNRNNPNLQEYYDNLKIPSYHLVKCYNEEQNNFLLVDGLMSPLEQIVLTNHTTSSSNITFNDLKSDYIQIAQEVIPPGEVSRNIEYIVKSIYNGSDVCWNIWISIGMAIKRVCSNDLQKGLDLWIEWSNKGNKGNVIYECNKYYPTFNNNRRGYGYSTLYFCASLCNPKLKGFNICDELTKTTTNFINTETYKERYVKPYDLDNYDIIIEESEMGTGKTYQVKESIINHNFKKVLLLTGRRAYACSMSAEFNTKNPHSLEFKKKGIYFDNYLDKGFKLKYNDKDYKDIRKSSHLFISLESIHKLDKGYLFDDDDGNITYDLLVIDESETIFNNFSSSTMVDRFKKNVSAFHNIFRNAKKILLLDAYISERTFTLVKELRANRLNVDNPLEKILYRKNEYKYPTRYYTLYSNFNKLIEPFDYLISKGKRVCLICGAREKSDNLYDELSAKYPNKRIAYYSRYRPYPPSQNAEVLWEHTDILIYTPTITIGISHTITNFDSLFIYASNSSCLVRDVFQATRRVRTFNDKVIHITINDEYKGFNDLPNTKGEIYKHYKEDFNKFYTDYKNAPKWLIETHLYNKLEENISRRNFKMLFLHYLQKENIRKYLNDFVDVLDGIEAFEPIEVPKGVNLLFTYERIDDINYVEYKMLKKHRKEGTLDIEELFKLRKYEFRMNTINDNEKQSLFWDTYFANDDIGNDGRIYYSNMKDEINYFDIFDFYERLKTKDIVYKEFIGTKIYKYRIIAQIKELLGFMDRKNGVLICSNDWKFTTKDLLKCRDFVRENFQNIKKGFDFRCKSKECNSEKVLKNIINHIFKEMFGFEFVSNASLLREQGLSVPRPYIKYTDGTRKRINNYTYKPNNICGAEMNNYDPYKIIKKTKNESTTTLLNKQYGKILSIEERNNIIDRKNKYTRQLKKIMNDNSQNEDLLYIGNKLLDNLNLGVVSLGMSVGNNVINFDNERDMFICSH